MTPIIQVVAGSIATLLFWILDVWRHVRVPDEVSAAVVVILVALIGFYYKEPIETK